MARSTKYLQHLWTNFSAADTQARTNRGDQIVRMRSESLAHRTNGRRRHALCGAAPSGMRRRDDVLAPIADQNRRAISDPHADCDRGIVGDRRVRLRPRAWKVLTSVQDGYLRAMHLPQQEHAIDSDVDLPTDAIPLVSRVAQLQVGDGEEVVGDVGEWAATQNEPPFGLRPLETIARLGLNHDYPRIGNRCHRHPAHRQRV